MILEGLILFSKVPSGRKNSQPFRDSWILELNRESPGGSSLDDLISQNEGSHVWLNDNIRRHALNASLRRSTGH